MDVFFVKRNPSYLLLGSTIAAILAQRFIITKTKSRKSQLNDFRLFFRIRRLQNNRIAERMKNIFKIRHNFEKSIDIAFSIVYIYLEGRSIRIFCKLCIVSLH